jgi:hypothetical protein
MTTKPDSLRPDSSNSAAASPVSSAAESIQPSALPATWPYVAAAVIGLLGLGWYFVGYPEGDDMRLASAPAIEARQTVGMRPSEMTAAEVRMELYSSVSAVRVTLQAMTNPTTTRTYLPQLQQAAERLDRVNGLIEQLSPAARRGMAASLGPTMRPLNHMFDRVLAMPEVADVAKPTIDQVRSRLDALARA